MFLFFALIFHPLFFFSPILVNTQVLENTIVPPSESIQQAINNANTGDIIQLEEGSYQGGIVINKSVSLFGSTTGVSEITGQSQTGILINRSQVIIQDITIRGFTEGITSILSNPIIENVNIQTAENLATQSYIDEQLFQEEINSEFSSRNLHDLANASYSKSIEIDEVITKLIIIGKGNDQISQMQMGLFHDRNGDMVSQIDEFVGYLVKSSSSNEKLLLNIPHPPLGSYLLKVHGYSVNPNGGLFNITIHSHYDYGIGFFGSHGEIKNNQVSNTSTGVLMHSSSETKIMGNTLIDNGIGIAMTLSNNNQIISNTAHNNDYGISIWSGDSNIITENSFRFNNVGSIFTDFNQNRMSSNQFNDNMKWGSIFIKSFVNEFLLNEISNNLDLDGLRLMFSSNNLIEHNNASFNGNSGIHLWLDNNNNTIANNFVSGNDQGIELKLSNTNIIRQNIIKEQEDHGIKVSYSSNNTISRNNITNNIKGIVFYVSSSNIVYLNNIDSNIEIQGDDLNQSTNSWNYQYPVGGNYWSNNLITDEYRDQTQSVSGPDGIDDQPYTVVNSGITDYFSLSTAYHSSNSLMVNTGVSYFLDFITDAEVTGLEKLNDRIEIELQSFGHHRLRIVTIDDFELLAHGTPDIFMGNSDVESYYYITSNEFISIYFEFSYVGIITVQIGLISENSSSNAITSDQNSSLIEFPIFPIVLIPFLTKFAKNNY